MNKNNEFIEWRLLKDSVRDPYRHFAIEEALLRGIDEGFTPPTLRLRQAEPSVWIGVYQYPEEDVDIKYCEEKGIKIVRRPNPGGAVYQDEGSFCYSLFFPKETVFNRLHIEKPEQLYAIAGKAVIDTCREYGVHAELSPINDITINGRKVYGSAQVQLYSGFVHSGTFLVKTDIDEMERCLIPSMLKYIDKGFRGVKERVINLCDAVGKDIQIEEVMEKLACHIARILGVDFRPGLLSDEEIKLVDSLYEEKYSKKEWTYRKREEYNTVISTKSRSGVITVGVSLDNEIITALEIKGDFLVPDQQELIRMISLLKGKPLSAVQGIVNAGRLPDDVGESLIGLFKDIGKKGGANDTGCR